MRPAILFLALLLAGLPRGTGADPVPAAPAPLDPACNAAPLETGCYRWHSQLPGDAILRGSALSPDGSTLYLTGMVEPSGRDLVLVALDAATGALSWRATYDRGTADVGRSVAVSPDGQTVVAVGYVGGSFDHQAWIVLAYDAKTGQPRWAAEHSRPDSHSFIADDVAIANGMVVVFGRTDANSPYSSDRLEIAGFDLVDGRRVWLRDLGESSALRVTVEAAPDGTSVITAHRGETAWAIRAIDAATGISRWEDARALPSAYGRAPSVAFGGGRMFVALPHGNYVGSTAVVLAYAADGSRLWQSLVPNLETLRAAPSLAAARDGSRLVVVADGHEPGILVDESQAAAGLDGATGAVLWTAGPTFHANPAEIVRHYHGALVSPDGAVAYALASGDQPPFLLAPTVTEWVVAFDLATGEQLRARKILTDDIHVGGFDDEVFNSFGQHLAPDGSVLIASGRFRFQAASFPPTSRVLPDAP